MDILDKLFGNTAKVRALRLFLFNPEQIFSAAEVSDRTQIRASDIRREISALEKIGLLKKRATTYKKRKTTGYAVDPSFVYLNELTEFISAARPLSDKDLTQRISKVGKIKTIILSGIFVNKSDESRLDILVVGDYIKQKSLTNTIAAIEAEMGRELRFASFETSDFKYRMSIYDKLLRDIFDYPHLVIFDKLSFI